jgi:radical SAM protein with 4Fe4S-binding SPASM domain
MHLINMNSLEAVRVPKNQITDIFIKIQNGQENQLSGFINAESFLTRLSPSVSEFHIDPVLVLSFDCNYRCTYCYQEDYKKLSARLSVNDLGKIDEFYNVYCDHYQLPKKYGEIKIVGGEPLLPKNRQVLESIFQRWNDQEFLITTNGTFIKDYFYLIGKYKIKLKVSLDGTRKMHYERRLTGDKYAYDKTLVGIKQLVEAQIPVTVLSVYNPNNYLKYPEYFDLMEACGWLRSPYLKLAFIPERGIGCDDIDLTYLHETLISFSKLKQLDGRTKHVNAKQLVPGTYTLEKALYDAQTNQVFDSYRCTLLEYPHYSFLPNGDVMFCLAFESRQGRIGRYKPDCDIDFVKIDKLRLRRIDNMSNCQSCNLKILCKGGCVATTSENSGNLEDTNCSFWKTPDFLNYLEEVIRDF